jgi:DNA-binding XRE family transcriptional regulator
LPKISPSDFKYKHKCLKNQHKCLRRRELSKKNGLKVKKMRMHLGLDQDQFSKILGIHRGSLSRIERDEILLSEKYAKRLMLLGLNPLYFFDESEPINLPGYTFEQVCKNVEEATNE